MNKRKLKLKEQGISRSRYKELRAFCEQYPEWKQELKYKTDTIKSKQVTDMPLPPLAAGDSTGKLAIEREKIQKKCKLIEDTAKEADQALCNYIISSACYKKPFWLLRDMECIPCSERAFYDIRRYFFYLLDKKKKE